MLVQQYMTSFWPTLAQFLVGSGNANILQGPDIIENTDNLNFGEDEKQEKFFFQEVMI